MRIISLCKLIHAPAELSENTTIDFNGTVQPSFTSTKEMRCPARFHGEVTRQGQEETWDGDRFLIHACKQWSFRDSLPTFFKTGSSLTVLNAA